MPKKTHYLRNGLVAIVALLVIIQLVPYGRSHANPPVVQEPAWNSPDTRALAQRACFDCHSNETVWPWYANVAPMSWLVQRDVDEGRSKMNFSEWGVARSAESAGEGERESENPTEEIPDVVREGEMPPLQYMLIHTNAHLSDTEKDQLISGLQTSLAQR